MTVTHAMSTDPPDAESVEQTAEPYTAGDEGEETDIVADATPRSTEPPSRSYPLTLIATLAIVIAVSALAAWLGWRAHQSHQAAEQRAMFVQAARQGALNLTTIDCQHADSDVARILALATGTFYDDFSKRSQPFVELVKKTQSKTEGSITAAGLESGSGTTAQVLVAVHVKSSNASVPERLPRSWRMRVTVQKVGDDIKVSNVEFVP